MYNCSYHFNPYNFPSMNPEEELIKFYGQPGDWSNLTQIELPYPMIIAWDEDSIVEKITVHKKIAKVTKKIFQDILDDYGYDEVKRLKLDLYGGAYNLRKMRGGSRWSLHSWGIAIDLAPEQNRLRWGSDKALFAQPEYHVVHYHFEKNGFYNLGREKDYDWMHFQAASV